MIKYDYLVVLVDWAPDDNTKLNSFGETGYRFVCYANNSPIYAIFEKKWKESEE